MLGAIAGDVIGSVYEHHHIKTTPFPLFGKRSTFTDDTVLTVAIANAILNQREYGITIKTFVREYQHAGYGLPFGRGFFKRMSFRTTALKMVRRCV